MNLHALGQKVGGGLVVGLVRDGDDAAGSARHRFLVAHQLRDHVFSVRRARFFLNLRAGRELRVRPRCRNAEGADPLGDFINGGRELRILLFKHLMQRIEHRARNVPMEVMGLQIKRVAVCQQIGEPIRNSEAVLLRYFYLDGVFLVLFHY